MKNGKSVDTEIVHSPDTYVYTKDLGKLDDVPIITVHISSILSDAETDMVVIDGIFQISENYTSVKIGDVYGEMEVKSVIESGIIMKNNRSIDLDAGTRQHVMGDMYFRIADDATAIRFYPFVERIIGNGADEIAPADAVIALQIAVGSSPFDSRYDVSGDGSVTSLDALMILQAVAGNREVPIGGCEGLDQNVLRRYDYDNNGLIDSNEMGKAKIGYESNYETPDDYAQILYAYEHNCPVEPAE
jgi:hypothetical protein